MRPNAIRLALALALLSACAPKDPHSLGHDLTVHGVVTDAATGALLQGVQVALLSADNFAPVTTNARGYFQFTNVLQVENLLIQFSMNGYATVTRAVDPTLVNPAVGPDGGIANFPGFDGADGFDASIALQQSLTLAVSGWVYAGADAAKQASVILADTSADAPVVAYQVKAGDDGKFSFAAVRPSTYELWVLPFDKDGDGISDYQLYRRSLGSLTSGANNLTNLVAVLLDVREDLEASSFVNVSTAYPISIAALQDGVSGVLQTPGPFTLHFGAEVDAALTSFTLAQIEASGRRTPIALTANWLDSVRVTLTPATALTPFPSGNTSYELRITALRFKDGTVAIAPGDTPGVLDFSVMSLPTPLANPTPAFYLASQLTATQAATRAVVDATNIWLLDANGDFVFDTVAAANWGPNNLPQISWQHVPGAVRYEIFARNTTTGGNGAGDTLQWRSLGTVAAPDPNANPTVVTTFNVWANNAFGSAGAPWAFGNGIDLAVASIDFNGFESPIDPSKVLATSDSFGGLVTNAAIDLNAAAPFNSTSERGASFTKAFRVDFSEPMSTTSPVAFASLSSNLTVARLAAVGWGTANAPSATPLNVAGSAYVSAQLKALGACTELLVARNAGDVVLPVRDASFFTAGATSKLVLLGTNGAFLAEAVNLASVSNGQITLAAGLPGTAGTQVAGAPSLVCALQAPATVAHATTIGNASATVVVDDASSFFIGESIALYEPQVSGAGQVLDVRTVNGIDTTSNSLVLSAAPGAGHTTATVVFSLSGFAAEQPLRGSALLTLTRDVTGQAAVDLPLAAAPNGVMVGDTLLVDADGDLKTTPDQVQVKVKALKLAAAPFAVTVDLPAGLNLLHGKSVVRALGDAITVSGVHDSSSIGSTAHNLDAHRDQFTADGVLF